MPLAPLPSPHTYLREYDEPVPPLLEPCGHTVHQLQLAAVRDEGGQVGRLVVCTRFKGEEERGRCVRVLRQ